jgi:hypothetical protein
VTVRALTALSLLLAACATGEPSASSYTNVTAGVSSVTVVGSSTGEVEATSETGEPEDDTTGQATTTTADPPTTSGPPTSDTTTDPTAVDPTTSTTGETTGGDACGGCDEPPGPCHDPVGQCIVGECVYSLTEAGLACDDGDGCTEDDACDGAGACEGAPVSCERPHATGGTCVDGACQGFQCTAPYDDCDGDMDNGCEVPVGVANQCDQNGLNPDNGCWTAYCGNLDDPNATNFGTYYCYDCANCNTPAAGMWRWCNHTTGNWYDAAMGTCPAASEDLACAPP